MIGRYRQLTYMYVYTGIYISLILYVNVRLQYPIPDKGLWAEMSYNHVVHV